MRLSLKKKKKASWLVRRLSQWRCLPPRLTIQVQCPGPSTEEMWSSTSTHVLWNACTRTHKIDKLILELYFLPVCTGFATYKICLFNSLARYRHLALHSVHSASLRQWCRDSILQIFIKLFRVISVFLPHTHTAVLVQDTRGVVIKN